MAFSIALSKNPISDSTSSGVADLTTGASRLAIAAPIIGPPLGFLLGFQTGMIHLPQSFGEGLQLSPSSR